MSSFLRQSAHASQLRLRTAPGRLTRNLVAAALIGVGSGLVGTVVVIYLTIVQTTSSSFELRGAPDSVVLGRSEVGVPVDLVNRLTGVADPAVAITRTSAAVDDVVVDVIGVNTAAAQLLPAGTLPPGRLSGRTAIMSDHVAADLGVADGSVLVLSSGGRTADVEVLVSNVVEYFGVADVVAVPVIVPIGVAQALRGAESFVEAVMLYDQTESDAAIEELVGAAGIRSEPTELALRDAAAAGPVVASLGLVALVTLLVGALAVFNATSMEIAQQSREIGTMQAIGVRAPVLFTSFLVEPVLVGAAGGVLAVLIAKLVSSRVIGDAAELLPGSSVTHGVAPPGGAFIVILVVSVISALVGAAVPVALALRRDPTHNLLDRVADEAPESPGMRTISAFVGGGMLVVGVLAVAIATNALVVLGVALSLAGLVVVSYAATIGLARTAAAVLSPRGHDGWLAARSVLAAPRRLWVASVAVGACAAVLVAVGGITRDALAAGEASIDPLRATDLYVDGTRVGQLPTSYVLPPDIAARVAAVPGVASVRSGTLTGVDSDYGRLLMQGLDGESATAMYQLASDEARAAVVGGTGVILTRRLAESHDLGVGATFRVASATGAIDRPVVDVVDYIGGLMTDVVLLSAADARAIADRGGPTFLEIHAVEGVPIDDLLAEVSRVVEAADPIARTITGDQHAEEASDTVEGFYAFLLGVRWPVAASAALALFNTMLLASSARRREFATLGAVGFDRRRIVRVVVLEAIVIAVVGVVLGTASGLLAHAMITKAATTVASFPIQFHFQPGAFPALAIALVAITAVGASAPAWYLSRLAPTEVLRRD